MKKIIAIAAVLASAQAFAFFDSSNTSATGAQNGSADVAGNGSAEGEATFSMDFSGKGRSSGDFKGNGTTDSNFAGYGYESAPGYAPAMPAAPAAQ